MCQLIVVRLPGYYEKVMEKTYHFIELQPKVETQFIKLLIGWGNGADRQTDSRLNHSQRSLATCI